LHSTAKASNQIAGKLGRSFFVSHQLMNLFKGHFRRDLCAPFILTTPDQAPLMIRARPVGERATGSCLDIDMPPTLHIEKDVEIANARVGACSFTESVTEAYDSHGTIPL
jgi:hypothetical protein